MHDGVEEAYEDVVLRRSGGVAIFRKGFWMVIAWFRFLLGLAQPRGTSCLQIVFRLSLDYC